MNKNSKAHGVFSLFLKINHFSASDPFIIISHLGPIEILICA